MPCGTDRCATEDVPALLPWARLWQRWASASFVRGYFDAAGDASYLPKGQDAFAAMLDFYLLDKAIYELRYELNNRPDWVGIPLEGIRRRLDTEAERPVGAGAPMSRAPARSPAAADPAELRAARGRQSTPIRTGFSGVIR